MSLQVERRAEVTVRQGPVTLILASTSVADTWSEDAGSGPPRKGWALVWLQMSKAAV